MGNSVMTIPERSVMDRIDRPVDPTRAEELEPACTFRIKDLSIWYGEKRAIDNVTLDIASNAVTAIIGPSGCGKSTFIRSLNRMHELVPKTRLEGTVLLDGEDLYSSDVDPAIVRRRVGMVLQKSNPFPTMSIGENVIIGLRLNGVRKQKFLNERLEKSLRMAGVCGELRDDLDKSGTSVSAAHQQTLWQTRAVGDATD